MGRKKTEDFSIKFYLLGGLSVDEWWEKLDVIKQEKIGLKLKTGGGGLKNFVKCLLKTVRGRSAASLPDMIIWVQADFMKITEPQTQWTFSHIIVWCATKSGTASRRSRQQQGQERFKARFFDTHVRYPSKTTRRKEKKSKKKPTVTSVQAAGTHTASCHFSCRSTCHCCCQPETFYLHPRAPIYKVS